MRNSDEIGLEIYQLVKELFPLARSLTGDGVRQTLGIIQRLIPQLAIIEVPSGTRCFDWTVPPEWNVRTAWIVDPSGNKIIDFDQNNLHLVGYSTPVDATFSLAELQSHLHSLPDQPDAVPYITSYYAPEWGFCLTDRQRRSLPAGKYQVRIDSSLCNGHLTYGELQIAGETTQEIFLSTYVCHPSMANNELSGPAVVAFLVRWLRSRPRLKYSYRIVFIPETIGSVLYLSRHLAELKSRVVAGYVVTCVGDDRSYSHLPSRTGNTLADRAAHHVLRHLCPEYIRYSYLDRGSDERQYCSPGVDLPMASIMRSKYGTYPEYHTSLDNLDFVTPAGLAGGYQALRAAIEAIEIDAVPRTTVICEPQLGRRGLYPNLSGEGGRAKVRNMMDLLAYADGNHSLLEIAEITGVPIVEMRKICDQLCAQGLLDLKPKTG